MKFYVIPNMTRANTFTVTSELLEKMHELGCTVYLDETLKPVSVRESV